MEKVYRILEWLEIEQAVDWLQDLTGTPVTHNELSQLCESKQCAAYADVNGIPSDQLGFDTGTALGIHLITNPMQAFGDGWGPRETWTKGDTYTQTGASLLFTSLPPWVRTPIFKREDIQALADKMNASANQPTVKEVEELREQLKKAVEAKENAWHLTDKYRAELEKLRETAEQDRSSTEAALLRAEQAEKHSEELAEQIDRIEAKADHCQDALDMSKAAVAELEGNLTQERMARKYAEGLALELRNELEDEYNARMAEKMEWEETRRGACEQAEEVPAIGITFPYATKQLVAMRDAAQAHWADHDRSKPAPYGIQKTVASYLADRTGQNSRKLTELAIAIKPDGLPKA